MVASDQGRSQLAAASKPAASIDVDSIVSNMACLYKWSSTSKNIQTDVFDILVNPMGELQQFDLQDRQENEYTS